MHKNYAHELNKVQSQITQFVNEASSNQELRQELKNQVNSIKDNAVVEQNKNEYTIQDIKEKYNKLNNRNKGEWKEVFGAFKPVSDLRDQSVANQKSIKKDIEN